MFLRSMVCAGLRTGLYSALGSWSHQRSLIPQRLGESCRPLADVALVSCCFLGRVCHGAQRALFKAVFMFQCGPRHSQAPPGPSSQRLGSSVSSASALPESGGLRGAGVLLQRELC